MVVAAVATTSRPATATARAVVAFVAGTTTSRLATTTALAVAFAAVATSSLTTPTTLVFVASAAIATSCLATASAFAAAGAFGALVGCGSHRSLRGGGRHIREAGATFWAFSEECEQGGNGRTVQKRKK